MPDFAGASLRIQPVGDKETIAALDKIDARAQKSAEAFTTLTNKSVSDAAAAFDRLYGKKAAADDAEIQRMGRIESVAYRMNDAIASAAERAAQRQANAMASADDAMALRQGRSIQSASRGLEIIARTGSATGRSMDNILASVSNIAFAFGPEGMLVGALAIAGTAIVDLFTRARKEMEKTQAEFNTRMIDMVKSASVAGLAGKYGVQTRLYSGDAAARIVSTGPSSDDANALKELGLSTGDKQVAYIARTQGILGLQRLRDQLTPQVKTITDTHSGIPMTVGPASELQATIQLLDQMQARLATVKKASDEVIKTTVDQVTEGIKLASEKKDNKSLFDPSAPGGAFTDKRYSLDAARDMAPSTLLRIPKKDELEMYEGILEKEYAIAKTESERLRINTEMAAVVKQIDEITAKAQIHIGPGTVEANAKKMAEQEKRALENPLKMLPTLSNNQVLLERFKEIERVATQESQRIGQAIAGSIETGIQAAFAHGATPGSVFHALEANILESIGTMFENIGEAALAGLTVMAKIKSALLAFEPEVGIPAALALIAIGATLKGVGGSIGSGGGGSGGGGSTNLPSIVDRQFITPSAPSGTVNSPSSITARPTNNIWVVGVNDPVAQRSLHQMITSYEKR